MKSRSEQEVLLQRYLDGNLTAEETSELESWLREDASARAWLREIAEQAVAMGDLARTRALKTPVATQVMRPRFSNVSWLALAASLAVAGVLSVLLLHRPTREAATVVEVIELNGAMSWSGANGERRHELAKGERLPAGTLEADGEGASAQIRFLDGSVISLSGESELTFSEQDQQKRLWLRRGSMSAQVQPQPAGRPMLVRTATAEAEVVGTVFSLSARPADTLLNVDEGLVKLKRLTDGHVIDVPAQTSALASLDAAERLGSASTPTPLTAWRFDFTTQMPPVRWRGIWHPSPDGAHGRMTSSAYVAARKADGTVITHYGVSVRTAYLDPPLSLKAQEGSVIRYRLRQEGSGSLQVMLFTNTPKGGFGGNFECKIQSRDLHLDADGWCDVAIPIGDFLPVVGQSKAARQKYLSPVGNTLTGILLSSFQQDMKLCVSSFELTVAAAR